LNPDFYKAAAGALAARREAIVDALTSRHFETHPELELRYGSAGREKCRQDAEYHLTYLEQAVAFASPELFADYVEWARTMLASRGIAETDLADHLGGLLASVRDHLAPEQMEAVDAVSFPALARLAPAGPPDESSPAGRFISALRTQGTDAGMRLVRELMASGLTLIEIYLDVLQASQNEIGRLWQLNKITVAEEHYCTAATQLVMAQLYPQIFAAGRNGPAVVIACVSGELHEVGARMVCDVLQLQGFNTFFLGASLPARDLVDFVADKHARIVGLSATISLHLGRLEATIRALREDPRTRGVKIMVGGYPFRRTPTLWKSAGADAFATDAREAVEVVKRLLRETTAGSLSVRSIGIACDQENRIKAVLHNQAGLRVEPGTALVDLFEQESKEKALRLLATARASGAAFGWELNVRVEDRIVLMSFVGAKAQEAVLLAGAETRAEANQLFARMIQTQGLPVPGETSPPAQAAPDLYEQLAELNNRLVTTQRELEKTNAEVQRVAADRAKLAAMAAHDLRNPLGVVMLCAEALTRALQPSSGSDAPGLIATIRRNTRRMQDLVDDLLHAFAAEIGALELVLQPMSLEELVRSNVEANRVLAAQKQIVLQLTSHGDVPPILGDPMRLEQVLDNLIHNAIKFSPRGSTIKVYVFSAGTHAGVTVEDQGAGLEREELEALLTGTSLRHRVGTESERGFGLGFAIIRAILDKHGGTISGDSVPGKGARFSVRLPAHWPAKRAT